MNNIEEIEVLLSMYKSKCFVIAHCCSDTDVEEESERDLETIKERIIELANNLN